MLLHVITNYIYIGIYIKKNSKFKEQMVKIHQVFERLEE